ncbi:MAG TPA: SPOR domain-containing protein [Sphingomicrobium sp.]|nr:SPOR domain-containing protein [Sphingomicrobium sp.]
MSDGRAAFREDLPWLEPVDDEAGPRGISAGRMAAAVAVVLLAALLVAGTFFWLGKRDPVGLAGAPELIRAEPGPYKTRPPNPGGLDVTGESETAFQTSAGEDADAQLDLSRMAERPPPPAEKPKTNPGEKVEPVAPAKPKSPTGAAGSVIQLGAFKNAAQAERAWTALAGRFPEIAQLEKMVVPFSGGIRLRAGAGSPDEARAACAALKAGGENCFVAN